MILHNCRITIREVANVIGYRSAHSKHFGRIFKAWNEDCFKIVKFWAKTTSHRYRLGDAQKVPNWWRIMGVWLWHWNQSQIIPMKVSRRTKTEKIISSSFKCEGFAYCFLRLQWRVVHHEFLPQGRTVNKEYYLEVMRRLRENIRQKCTELWKNQSWILHQDN